MPRKKTPPESGDPVSKRYIPKDTRELLRLRELNKHANAFDRLIINENITEAKKIASLKSVLKRDSHPARHRSLPPLDFFLKPLPVPPKTEGTRKSTRKTQQPDRLDPAKEEKRQKEAQEKARRKKKGLTEEQLEEQEIQEIIELQQKQIEEKAEKELKQLKKEQLQEQLQIRTRKKQGLPKIKTKAEEDFAKLEDSRNQQNHFVFRLSSKVKEYIKNQFNPDEDDQLINIKISTYIKRMVKSFINFIVSYIFRKKTIKEKIRENNKRALGHPAVHQFANVPKYIKTDCLYPITKHTKLLKTRY